MGSIDWQLMGVLLIGSLPGIAIGSYCAVRVPETALRLLLAAILIVVAGRLGAEQWRSSASNIAAVSERAPSRQSSPGGGADCGWRAPGQLIPASADRLRGHRICLPKLEV